MSILNETTSGGRPTDLGVSDKGKMYFETDTNNIVVWDGTNWRGFSNDGIRNLNNTLSASFDGTDDQINCGTDTGLDPSSWTINQWLRIDTLSTSVSNINTFVTRRDGSGGFQLFEQTGSLRYYTGGASNDVIIGAGVFSANTWYMVTVTHDGSTVKGYINGSFVGSGSDTYTTSGTGNSFYIGFHSAGAVHTLINFDGFIDETAIWSSVLTTNEISSIYNQRVPINLNSDAGYYTSSADLVGWWRMGDGSGDTVFGGGTPASGSAIGTVKNIANPGFHDGTASGVVYSDEVVS